MGEAQSEIKATYVNAADMHHESAAKADESSPTKEEPLSDYSVKNRDSKLSPKIVIMKPVLRFLQLLCENHNSDLQVNYV